MKPDKKRLILRAVIFAVFVFGVVAFPRILPYTYPGDQYYVTYIQDGWDIFFVVFLYPPAFLLSGVLCTLLEYKLPVLWVIPDILVCLPEFYDRADTNIGFRTHTFWFNIALHLLIWIIGMLLVYGLRPLIARVRHLIQCYKAEYRTYQNRINPK